MVDLNDCDREPIHIPGTIQPFGVLLVLVEGAERHAGQRQRRPTSFAGRRRRPRPAALQIIDPLRGCSAGSLRDERWHDANPLSIQRAAGSRFDGIVHRHEGAAILELEPNPSRSSRAARSPPVPARR